MEPHYHLSDEAFEKFFQKATLEPSVFTHEAHLRLAWIHLKRYRLEEAIVNITSQLKNYVKQWSAEEKYNETVTVAAIYAVHHFMKRSEVKTFQLFIAENHYLKSRFRQLLQSHYSRNIFTEAEAKALFIQPDLVPFD